MLPDGLKTRVGNDGIKVSGGEKQRIAIARAIYKDPEILFLDEFTSAIDAQTEQEIIDKIEKNSKNKTIIIIAHRSTTISKCKNVWQLENGAIKKV
jgi:ABC-type multidrug transport system fused ATPase/permease subunit